MQSFSYRRHLCWPRTESGLHRTSVLSFSCTVDSRIGVWMFWKEVSPSQTGNFWPLTATWGDVWGLKRSRMDRIWLKMRQTHWCLIAWNYVSVIPTGVTGFLFLRVSPDGSSSMSEVWFPRGDVSLGKPVTHWEPRGFNPKQLLTWFLHWWDQVRRDSMIFPIASC